MRSIAKRPLHLPLPKTDLFRAHRLIIDASPFPLHRSSPYTPLQSFGCDCYRSVRHFRAPVVSSPTRLLTSQGHGHQPQPGAAPAYHHSRSRRYPCSLCRDTHLFSASPRRCCSFCCCCCCCYCLNPCGGMITVDTLTSCFIGEASSPFRDIR